MTTQLKEKIRKLIKDQQGDGFTFILFGTDARYVIGLTNNTSTASTREQAYLENETKILKQIEKLQERFSTITIGGWEDKGIKYIDVGTTEDEKEWAMVLGSYYKQQTIYDQKTEKCYDVNIT